MTDATPRLQLPFLAAGQAQKEVLHNEALLTIDALMQPVVEGAPADVPPEAPAAGQCWIVGDAPTGDWAGQPGALACWGEGGWRFVAPHEGMLLWRRDNGRWQTRNSSGWTDLLPVAGLCVNGDRVVGPRGAAIADPLGGTTVDAAARNAIAAVLSALRGHGLIAG